MDSQDHITVSSQNTTIYVHEHDNASIITTTDSESIDTASDIESIDTFSDDEGDDKAKDLDSDATTQLTFEEQVQTAIEAINDANRFAVFLSTNMSAAIASFSAETGVSLQESEEMIQARFAAYQALIHQFGKEIDQARCFVDYSQENRVDEMDLIM